MLKTMKWAAIIGVVADVTCLGAGYYVYQQMKNSSDFRYKIYKYDERMVDVYYRANEKYGNGSAREEDYKKWGISEIKSFDSLRIMGF
ncbi:uncharacterized protein TNIN_429981 [Trichonephila inaurata madagascariensis]|uniref:Uncharacterized protein n=1 Tax=Trichonephila inaurata madagascariensis TaxID=2747483 RepID=A0A8X6WVQ6_9ARAC|nr:uncharacterized protein TNIN_429981 [Trichonephila inaurata madagascariensis]